MAIVWTKDWDASDDGTVLKAVDLKNIQDDINTTGLADADKIQGIDVVAPTPSDDGKALTYTDSVPEFSYTSLSGLPSGIYLPYGGSSAPSGWQLCDGTAVSRTTFADLFTAIGTAFGVGDGSTTFNLPDMRGRQPLGKDDMGGVSADVVTDASADTIGGTLGAETIDLEHNHGGATGGVSFGGGGSDTAGALDTKHTHSISNDLSTTQTVMNPVLTSNWIIKN